MCRYLTTNDLVYDQMKQFVQQQNNTVKKNKNNVLIHFEILLVYTTEQCCQLNSYLFSQKSRPVFKSRNNYKFLDFRFSLCWVFAVYDILFVLFLILYIWTKFSHPLTLLYYHPPTNFRIIPSIHSSIDELQLEEVTSNLKCLFKRETNTD